MEGEAERCHCDNSSFISMLVCLFVICFFSFCCCCSCFFVFVFLLVFFFFSPFFFFFLFYSIYWNNFNMDEISYYSTRLFVFTQESKFMIFSDSLSALQALEKIKTDHPLLIQIQDMLHKIEVDQNEAVFIWVPEHVGIRGNEAADRAAIEALDKEHTDDLIPFSDLKPLTAKYIHQVWQKDRD